MTDLRPQHHIADRGVITRRRFLRVSALSVGAVAIGDFALSQLGPARAAVNRATSWNDILAATPGLLPGGSQPAQLIPTAAQYGQTLEALGELDGTTQLVQLSLQRFDEAFPFKASFGQLSAAHRAGAVSWATRTKDQFPDLGPRKAGLPRTQKPSSNAAVQSPDHSWQVEINRILQLSTGLNLFLTQVLPFFDDEVFVSQPAATATSVTLTQEP